MLKNIISNFLLFREIPEFVRKVESNHSRNLYSLIEDLEISMVSYRNCRCEDLLSLLDLLIHERILL